MNKEEAAARLAPIYQPVRVAQMYRLPTPVSFITLMRKNESSLSVRPKLSRRRLGCGGERGFFRLRWCNDRLIARQTLRWQCGLYEKDEKKKSGWKE